MGGKKISFQGDVRLAQRPLGDLVFYSSISGHIGFKPPCWWLSELSHLTWLHPLQRLSSTFLYLKLPREYHQPSLYPKYLYCPLSRDSVCKALTNVFLCEENISDEIKAVIEDRKFPVSGLCLATYRIPMQFTQHTIWWHNQPRIFPKVLHRINSIYAIKSWKIKLKLFQLCSSLALKEVLQKKHHCSCLHTKKGR